MSSRHLANPGALVPWTFAAGEGTVLKGVLTWDIFMSGSYGKRGNRQMDDFTRLYARGIFWLSIIIVVGSLVLLGKKVITGSASTIRPEYVVTTVFAAALAVITFLTSSTVAVRYIAAALGRIKLDKSDIYFIAGAALSIVALVIGHFWK